ERDGDRHDGRNHTTPVAEADGQDGVHNHGDNEQWKDDIHHGLLKFEMADGVNLNKYYFTI
ncbi:MAG TPA: hypothetical protein VLF64_03005, partial [Candidatus Saccharimonadales bacterium]|nr:hypothetical protein [Candidatus Saccharimonadales bacterium]